MNVLVIASRSELNTHPVNCFKATSFSEPDNFTGFADKLNKAFLCIEYIDDEDDNNALDDHCKDIATRGRNHNKIRCMKFTGQNQPQL